MIAGGRFWSGIGCSFLGFQSEITNLKSKMSHLWINGELIDKADAKVSPFDHGFLYGDGVWEPLRVFGGRLFQTAGHLHHLFESARTHGIDIPLSREELLAAIETTLRANDRLNGYVRVIVSRGPGTLGPDPRKLDPQVIIMAEEYYPFPLELYPHGLHAVTFAAPPGVVRLLGQPHLAQAKRRAIECGCLEAILTDPAGRLTGTTEGMLFLVKDEALVVASGHIPETTGYAVLAMAGESGLVVIEYAVKSETLFAAGEAFLAGTSCGVIGIVKVDDRVIGSGVEGPITRRLRERFLAVTRGGG
jgi:branched-chain amino acid aminotransferase